jgi:cytochrome c biogenesis protein CcdA/thiol-disulfide isomerase/thioredoxin
MIILLIFAFLSGVFTVLSPCILPVLPIILAAGTATGKWRPWGIIAGLILSFTFFTLALTAIVHTTQISADFFRYFAVVLILAFGLIMILPALSDWFAKITSPLANLGLHIQKSQTENGFSGGFVLGIALGLLWTPCAGPILASVSTLAATQSINVDTILITLFYSIGAGIPMFLIVFGGGKIIQSSKFLSKHSQGIRQTFGGVMILTAVAITLHWDMVFQQQITSLYPPIVIDDNPLVKQELEKMMGIKEGTATSQVSLGVLPNYGKAAELAGISGWINSPPLTLSKLHGKVVLIDFWTYSCINCLRSLPYIKKWYADYKDKGFIVIGVHAPEFEFEKDQQNVESAVKRLGITYPVAQDNEFRTWQAYKNVYWPSRYLIDQNGNIRSLHFGEGDYVETENAIRKLLGLPEINKAEQTLAINPISHEIYLGLKRGASYSNEITLKPNESISYNYKKPLSDDEVGLKGKWKAEDESITSEADDGVINFNFLAKQVYCVLSGESKVPVEVYLDGKLVGTFTVDGARKYDIVNTTYGRHTLSIKIPKGISAYSFTFGNE